MDSSQIHSTKLFSPSLDQIVDVRVLLLTKLPLEIVDTVIVEADYRARIWAGVRVDADDDDIGDSWDNSHDEDEDEEEHSNTLRTPHNREVEGHTGSNHDDDSGGDAEFAVDHSRVIVVSAEYQPFNTTEKLLVTKAIPEKPERVRASEDDRIPRIERVVFCFESHDQGWGGESGLVGPYDGSFTWFEAVIYRPDENGGPIIEKIPPGAFINNEGISGKYKPVGSWVIQRNMRADGEYREYEIVWTKESNFEWDGTVGCGTGKGFVEALEPGDKIGIIARAQYPGWVNNTWNAEVEVVLSC
ncbi:hypothetical protein BDN72DRAFT_904817 [Pluteus cervinus]|uniref:Uncharacterized protein n=1 Tax=Pluteus cervinus TaxID=181527 RepID=A0ACD3A4N7_9AGAR|nr:hypothetical protein BDN72DRAFT_904817 [Pluteus cervinus]